LFFYFKTVKIPVLCYHSLHAQNNSYTGNDHIAMQRDLDTIRGLGYQLISLSAIVDSLLTDKLNRYKGKKVLGISFDDGPDWDWYDYEGEVAPEIRTV